jgi:hypothetical protein
MVGGPAHGPRVDAVQLAACARARALLGLLIGVQGAEKVSKFTCPFANDGKQFTLLPKKFTLEFTKQQKKFTWLKKSLHGCKKSLHCCRKSLHDL